MDNPQKFSSSKDVITFLAETFPSCFSIKGDAKPLKIGIFQDLAQRLDNEERVSKTLLRSSLRHYTNSWRYLHCIQKDAKRVDLDGNPVADIDDEHVAHAKLQLDESKAKVAEKRKEQNKAKANAAKKARKDMPKFKSGSSKADKKAAPKEKLPPAEKLQDSHLKPGTAVTVKLGKAPMPATITEIAKDGIQVQLDTGMTVKVQVDNLRLAQPKR